MRTIIFAGMGLAGDELSKAAWEQLSPQLAGKSGDVGRTAVDNRLFLNAVLWVMRHGGTWRVLPERFGKHDTVRKRALRWAQKGTWQRLFAAVRLPEVEAVLLDSTLVRAHQRASGQVKKARRRRSPRAPTRRASDQVACSRRRGWQAPRPTARAGPASRLHPGAGTARCRGADALSAGRQGLRYQRHRRGRRTGRGRSRDSK